MPIQYTTATPLLSRAFLLGEGPNWQPGANVLHFVDIKTGSLFRWNPQDATLAETQLGQYPGAALPTKSGRILAALATGVYLYSDTEGLRLVCRPPQLTANLRLNDAKVDPAGNLWFGTIELFSGVPAEGSLFCMRPDGSCKRMLAGVQISNGLDWSLDGRTMYYIDTPTGGVDAFDYNAATGDIENRRRIYTVAQGLPDGMTLDADGMLWVALWGGGKVIRVNPATGEMLAEVPLPATNVTCCCFIGEGYDTLAITTSGEGLPQPGNGQVFTLRPDGVRGRAPFVFDDSIIS